MTENERFGLVFTKTGSINSGKKRSGGEGKLAEEKRMVWEM
jgi:hypothetical protein